ncbi:hypothetical protein J6590_048561 [Homalodisca vitripennis]|nr:hypothetical protein J6590_048561 [Homalodisca vitripennis]
MIAIDPLTVSIDRGFYIHHLAPIPSRPKVRVARVGWPFHHQVLYDPVPLAPDWHLPPATCPRLWKEGKRPGKKQEGTLIRAATRLFPAVVLYRPIALIINPLHVLFPLFLVLSRLHRMLNSQRCSEQPRLLILIALSKSCNELSSAAFKVIRASVSSASARKISQCN